MTVTKLKVKALNASVHSSNHATVALAKVAWR
jgi:hypothetical protein